MNTNYWFNNDEPNAVGKLNKLMFYDESAPHFLHETKLGPIQLFSPLIKVPILHPLIIKKSTSFISEVACL